MKLSFRICLYFRQFS